ncbi:hypothetical protein, partial [Christensenella hongkongensis]|uniref:hypothetical protein n=1 Tax=Christensenella hongkongensis TaxID=270498 RepID=UPI0026735E0C
MLKDSIKEATGTLVTTTNEVCETHLSGFDKSIKEVKNASRSYVNTVTQDIKKSLNVLKTCKGLFIALCVVPAISGLWYILTRIF